MTATLSTVRLDIYAVKLFDSEAGGWVYAFMSRDKQEALNVKRFHEQPRLGVTPRVKLVHPSQRVVELFLRAGNEIYGSEPVHGRRGRL